MTRLANSRRKSRRYIQTAVSVSVTPEEIKAAIGDPTVGEIPMETDPANPNVRYASLPFRPGSESVFVNGVRMPADDYELLVGDNGQAAGILSAAVDEQDEVTLTADVVEQ